MAPAAPSGSPAAASSDVPASPFDRRRFRFTAGLPAGQTASVRDDDNNVVFTYRSFSSAVSVVAIATAAIVALSGVAAAAFLIAEKHPLSAAGALILTGFFALLILMLVPATTVTLFHSAAPVLTIAQRSRSLVPAAEYAVVTPDGAPLALLRKSVFSRLGRNRWQVLDAQRRHLADAIEESLSRALVRKVAGKFNRDFEADVRVIAHGEDAARIIRRKNGTRDVDVLEIKTGAIDRRVAVALATLILGSEP